MLNFDDLKQLINDEQKPTEKEQAKIDTERAKAEYYQAKAEAERIKAETESRKQLSKEDKNKDIIFLLSTLIAVIGIIAQVVVLVKIMI